MSFDADDEILQDFLIEAGEILEHLSEQLVELEQKPDDKQLLNAIFRGFHTVKGGAGFLQLDALVTICHAAESVFDLLRNDKRQVTAELMDVILQSLDTVNSMFRQVQSRESPTPASPSLLEALHRLEQGEVVPAAAPKAPPAPAPTVSAPVSAPAPEAKVSDIISDEEFESLMHALHEEPAAPASPAPMPAKPVPVTPAPAAAPVSGAGDEITEAEFEALLDQLHGSKAPGGSVAPTAPTTAPATKPAPAPVPERPKTPPSMDEFSVAVESEKRADAVRVPAAPPQGSDISEAEFEALLDQLHGAGKGPGVVAGTHAPVPAPHVSAPAAPSPVHAPAAAAIPSVAPAKVDLHGPDKGAISVDMSQETTVRVDTKRLDDIMNMVGELVLVRNRLVRLGLNNIDEEISKAVANLDVVTADLQMAVMKTRMQPIKKVFGRFPRVVRDLARNLKKEVDLELIGEDTDLDKNLVEALADPLVHLVRNAVDHGIESPAARENKGKSRVGHIVLSAQQEGDHIVLSISDDGAGMDPDRLRMKAVEKGLLDEDTAARLSDVEAFNLIFHPGFSTKDEISDVSGRGVGMDVVKTKISQLNGSIDISSEKDRGSIFAIKVPLTLAIMPTLMIMLGQQTFALPLVSVNEIFHMDVSKKNIVDGQDVIIVREKALPLFYLKRWLVTQHSARPHSDNAHVVIVSVGTKKVGFVVDQLIGQEEVVIKPLGAMLQGTPGIAGATITGDGRIALILDVPSMLKHYANRI